MTSPEPLPFSSSCPPPAPPPSSPVPMRATARTDEDLLALAPVLLGFWPEQDVVMLTFGGDRGFHARVDLPRLPGDTWADESGEGQREELELLAASLVVPAARFRVAGVVLLFYVDDVRSPRAMEEARTAWDEIQVAAAIAEVPVETALAADGRRLRSLVRGVDHVVRPYDVSTHPFVLRAQVEGRIGFRDRAAMVASLQADPEAVERTRSAVRRRDAAATPIRASRSRSLTVAEARDRLLEHAGAGTIPGPDDYAAILIALRAAGAWDQVCTDTAAPVERGRWLWAHLLPCTPPDQAAGAATALGFAAWRSGDGAMAWAAVDRARQAVPACASAEVLADLLENAVPPPQ